jgi:outer membrane biosynthesis protein TonB
MLASNKDGVMKKDINKKKEFIKRAIVLLGVLGFLYFLGFILKDFFKGQSHPKKQITTIKLLPDTPPPPPPPPPPPKEQPKEVQKAPEQKPVELPPTETLKMEGAAGDAPSAFQSGNVTNDYKGGKTIGSDSKFSWYASIVKTEIEKALQRNQVLKDGQYKVVVSIWVRPNGEIEKLVVMQSDATPEIEQALKTTLDNMQSIKQPLPEGMPQPLKLRITARKMGN